MLFLFSISSKVETLRLDNETMFLLHGVMRVMVDDEGIENEGVNVGFRVDEQTWRDHNVGDVLAFAPTAQEPV